jgi:hypothetical protein
MTIADEIHALASWHAPALSDPSDATRLTLRRVRR